MGISAATKDQQIIGLIVEAIVLERALATSHRIDSEHKRAFADTFSEELARQLVQRGVNPKKFQQQKVELAIGWRVNERFASNEPSAVTDLVMDIAASLSRGSGLPHIGYVHGLMSYFCGIIDMYRETLSLVEQESARSPIDSAPTGCLVPLAVLVAGASALALF